MSLIHLEHDFGAKLSTNACLFGLGDVLLEEDKPMRYIILLQGACKCKMILFHFPCCTIFVIN